MQTNKDSKFEIINKNFEIIQKWQEAIVNTNIKANYLQILKFNNRVYPLGTEPTKGYQYIMADLKCFLYIYKKLKFRYESGLTSKYSFRAGYGRNTCFYPIECLLLCVI